jgi:2-amino-4-hydroxy-6-hydroxymethyldihydropteridine diphosphokinase
MPVVAFLLLGSNLGNRAALLQAARTALYETAAWGREDQPAFLNQALAIRTTLTAEQLLAQCLTTERDAGRERRERWGSRTLDVDILLYGSAVIASAALTVPHPRLPERRFALVPLAEIASSVVHPQLGVAVSELLARCPDPLPVRRWPGESS